MKTFIPTPSSSTLELGLFTLHYYALCILLGIFVAIWVTKKRYFALGGNPNDISDLAIYVIPAGIIGGFEGSKARDVLVKDMIHLEEILQKLRNR